MKKTRLFFLTLLAAALASCNPQDPYVPEEFSIEHGVFVLNEGNYTFGSSSLTFYDPEADTVINSLF